MNSNHLNLRTIHQLHFCHHRPTAQVVERLMNKERQRQSLKVHPCVNDYTLDVGRNLLFFQQHIFVSALSRDF